MRGLLGAVAWVIIGWVASEAWGQYGLYGSPEMVPLGAPSPATLYAEQGYVVPGYAAPGYPAPGNGSHGSAPGVNLPSAQPGYGAQARQFQAYRGEASGYQPSWAAAPVAAPGPAYPTQPTPYPAAPTRPIAASGPAVPYYATAQASGPAFEGQGLASPGPLAQGPAIPLQPAGTVSPPKQPAPMPAATRWCCSCSAILPRRTCGGTSFPMSRRAPAASRRT